VSPSPPESSRIPEPWDCPTCGDPMMFEILDDERFLVAWSCVTCGLVRTTEPT
jgi:rubredoxin